MENEQITLDNESAEIVTELIDNPPAPTEEIKKLFSDRCDK